MKQNNSYPDTDVAAEMVVAFKNLAKAIAWFVLLVAGTLTCITALIIPHTGRSPVGKH